MCSDPGLPSLTFKSKSVLSNLHFWAQLFRNLLLAIWVTNFASWNPFQIRIPTWSVNFFFYMRLSHTEHPPVSRESKLRWEFRWWAVLAWGKEIFNKALWGSKEFSWREQQMLICGIPLRIFPHRHRPQWMLMGIKWARKDFQRHVHGLISC